MRPNVAVDSRMPVPAEPERNKKGRRGDPFSILQSLFVFKKLEELEITFLLTESLIATRNNISMSIYSS
jgi:hypothetical protein